MIVQLCTNVIYYSYSYIYYWHVWIKGSSESICWILLWHISKSNFAFGEPARGIFSSSSSIAESPGGCATNTKSHHGTIYRSCLLRVGTMCTQLLIHLHCHPQFHASYDAKGPSAIALKHKQWWPRNVAMENARSGLILPEWSCLAEHHPCRYA